MENELFEKTKVSKAYMTLALPVVLGMVVSLIYNMVDTFFIARTGNTALIAGVSLGTPIFTLMIALGDIFGVGGSSVISRLFGKKEYEDGRRISVFCFYAAIAVGIAVSIILLAAKQPILGLLGCDETTWQYAGDYYQWIALGAPFIILQLTPNCGIFCPAPEKFPILFLCTPGGKFLQAHVKAVGDTALSHFLPLP